LRQEDVLRPHLLEQIKPDGKRFILLADLADGQDPRPDVRDVLERRNFRRQAPASPLFAH
jgi:hypothetical protein